MRGPTSVSLGSSSDPNQKESWRVEGSEDKKDWRRSAADGEISRRWREEERETGLLGGRRDRRKTDRRVDNVLARDSIDSRTLPSSDRWHDNPRRDSKWSSRWGPEDKEKESRNEKRIDVEKDKDDAHTDSQSFVSSNRSASERDPDTRDKWRPRHRMEVHSGGSTSYRAAPGFGIERGRVESSNLGFTMGRGRSNVIGRGTSAGPIGALQSESVPGKPTLSADTFCYPRAKLLDIYRRQKNDPSFTTMPDGMEELSPLTHAHVIKPMAFVTPDPEEEVKPEHHLSKCPLLIGKDIFFFCPLIDYVIFCLKLGSLDANRLSLVMYGRERLPVAGWYTIHLDREDQLIMSQVLKYSQ